MENLKIKTFSGEKKLPSNIEAEQALIGSVLVNNDIITYEFNVSRYEKYRLPKQLKFIY